MEAAESRKLNFKALIRKTHHDGPRIPAKELQAEIQRRRIKKAREVQMLLNSLVRSPKVS